jgi:hypothetical protein
MLQLPLIQTRGGPQEAEPRTNSHRFSYSEMGSNNSREYDHVAWLNYLALRASLPGWVGGKEKFTKTIDVGMYTR